MSKSKLVPEFYCPTGCEKVVDKDKSNDNWTVQASVCPTCGKRLKFRMTTQTSPGGKEGGQKMSKSNPSDKAMEITTDDVISDTEDYVDE